MITTRRKITNEQQRFGGYAAQPAAVTMRERGTAARTPIADGSLYVPRNGQEDSCSQNTWSVTNEGIPTYTRPTRDYARQDYEQSSYAPPETDYSVAPVQQEAVPQTAQVIRYTRRGEQAHTAVTRKKNSAAGEIMPNVEASMPEPVQEKKPRAKMSAKNKAALFAYVAVVIILAVMVIATGLAVSNVNARADRLQDEIAYKSELVAEQRSQITLLTDREHIMGAAVGNGMEVIDPDKTVQVEMIEQQNPINYERRTNWFDKFCDFLSKIVGG